MVLEWRFLNLSDMPKNGRNRGSGKRSLELVHRDLFGRFTMGDRFFDFASKFQNSTFELKKFFQFAIFNSRVPEIGERDFFYLADNAGIHGSVAYNQHVFAFCQLWFNDFM